MNDSELDDLDKMVPLVQHGPWHRHGRPTGHKGAQAGTRRTKFCPKGHERTRVNAPSRASGAKWECLECKNERQREKNAPRIEAKYAQYLRNRGWLVTPPSDGGEAGQDD